MLGGTLAACQFPDYVITPPAKDPSKELAQTRGNITKWATKVWIR